MANPIHSGRRPMMRPKANPIAKSITIAMPFETRMARATVSMKGNGIATGKVDARKR